MGLIKKELNERENVNYIAGSSSSSVLERGSPRN